MSKHNETIFQQVAAEYDGVHLSIGSLFEMVKFHIDQGLVSTASAIANEAYHLFDIEAFIIEGETSATDLFLEVFRRVSFAPIEDGVHSMRTYTQWVDDMGKAKDFLVAYARQVKAGECHGDT